MQAFEIHGHRETGDATRDPYVETVLRGMNYLMTRLEHVNIDVEPYGDPDGNSNGIGIDVNESTPLYQVGQVMDALVAGDEPDRIARTGPVNVKGRRYEDIMQDMIDLYAWAQSDELPQGGGWRYAAHENPDNSAAQWGAIGMIAAEQIWGLSTPQWVKDRNRVWVEYSKRPGALGYGYAGPGAPTECFVCHDPGRPWSSWPGSG